MRVKSSSVCRVPCLKAVPGGSVSINLTGAIKVVSAKSSGSSSPFLEQSTIDKLSIKAITEKTASCFIDIIRNLLIVVCLFEQGVVLLFTAIVICKQLVSGKCHIKDLEIVDHSTK